MHSSLQIILGMAVTEYKSLKNVAQWEIGLCQLMLCDWTDAAAVWRELELHANWSKVCTHSLKAKGYLFLTYCRQFTRML